MLTYLRSHIRSCCKLMYTAFCPSQSLVRQGSAKNGNMIYCAACRDDGGRPEWLIGFTIQKILLADLKAKLHKESPTSIQ